ncbi:MAG: copper chaperone PCu(A)C [Thiogranum sp.]
MRSFILTVLLYTWSLLAVAEPAVLVENAWVREAPPGAQMMSAYMTLKNTGTDDAVLVSVASPAFTMVMLHKSEVVDGIARMLHQDELVIPAGGAVELKPGSFHLMMPAPGERLQDGDRVEFDLGFADGSSTRIQADVRKKP